MTLRKIPTDNSVRYISKNGHLLCKQALPISKEKKTIFSNNNFKVSRKKKTLFEKVQLEKI